MTWQYYELPDQLRVPPCPQCGNRLRVRQIVASLFLCFECRPEHLFRAVWREEKQVKFTVRKVAS